MQTSSFLYVKPGEEENHPVKNCKFTICYKNSDGKSSAGATPTNCVVMNFGSDKLRAVKQIQYSETLGEEFAVRVLNVDETDKDAVKVIYEFFDQDIGGYFLQLDQQKEMQLLNPEAWYERTSSKALPIVRDLWRATIKCGEKGLKMMYVREDGRYKLDSNNHNMLHNPLIAIVNGKPKFFNFYPGDAPKPDMSLPLRVFSNWANRENLNSNIAASICDKENSAQHKLMDGVMVAWTKMPTQGAKIPNYNSYKLHVPAQLLDLDAKTRVVEWFNSFACDVPAVQQWLDKQSWKQFESLMTQSMHSQEYARLLSYKNTQGYSQGRDIPRCIRNGVKHMKEHLLAVFKQNQKQNQQQNQQQIQQVVMPKISEQRVMDIMEKDLDIINKILGYAVQLVNLQSLPTLKSPEWLTHRVDLENFILKLLAY